MKRRQIFGRVGFRDTYFHIFRGIGRIGRLDSDHFLFATAGVRLLNSIKLDIPITFVSFSFFPFHGVDSRGKQR